MECKAVSFPSHQPEINATTGGRFHLKEHRIPIRFNNIEDSDSDNEDDDDCSHEDSYDSSVARLHEADMLQKVEVVAQTHFVVDIKVQKGRIKFTPMQKASYDNLLHGKQEHVSLTTKKVKSMQMNDQDQNLTP